MHSARRHRERINAGQGRFAAMFVPFHYNHFDPDGHRAMAQSVLHALVRGDAMGTVAADSSVMGTRRLPRLPSSSSCAAAAP